MTTVAQKGDQRLEIRKCDQLTNGPTDGLTWVGARDTCVSKKGSIHEGFVTVRGILFAASASQGAGWFEIKHTMQVLCNEMVRGSHLKLWENAETFK